MDVTVSVSVTPERPRGRARNDGIPTDVYYWPKKQREEYGRGKTGKLHVKCAVADGS